MFRSPIGLFFGGMAVLLATRSALAWREEGLVATHGRLAAAQITHRDVSTSKYGRTHEIGYRFAVPGEPAWRLSWRVEVPVEEAYWKTLSVGQRIEIRYVPWRPYDSRPARGSLESALAKQGFVLALCSLGIPVALALFAAWATPRRLR
jgi:hypothetical protein